MTPSICVVVPTYLRPQLLERCLEALFAQDLPAGQFEIVVADDGPSEATQALVQTFAQRASGPRMHYVAVDGAHGPAAARNRGWQSAAAPLIAFTDDDCQPERAWLREGLRALQHGADAAWGRLVMPLPPTPTDYEKDAAGLARAEFVTANCFCRKDVLEKIGGFDTRFRLAWREDSDLYFKLLDRGARIEHAPEAVVVHPIRPAPWGISVSQQKKILYDALLYKKHPRHYREKIRSQPPWHYYVTVAAGIAALGLLAMQRIDAAALAAAVWAAFTLAFFAQRIRDTSRRPGHIAEMLFTSVLIPPLALFWHWRGAFRFRVLYA